MGDIHTPDLDVNPSEDRGIKGLRGVFDVRFGVRWSSGCQELGKTEVILGWPPSGACGHGRFFTLKA